jgi:hypothetical protein
MSSEPVPSGPTGHGPSPATAGGAAATPVPGDETATTAGSAAPDGPPELPGRALGELLQAAGSDLARTLGLAPGARFIAGETLGVGSYGVVTALHDQSLQRELAVKVLALPATPDGMASFVREAQLTAALSHPNVLPVHDLGLTSRGELFFLMKKIDGSSLAYAIEQSGAQSRDATIADINAVVTLVIQVAQALAYAHSRGILHQDIKPGNIMLGRYGEVLLVDWGSATRLDQRSSGTLTGTPLYMAPEQARRERVDARSDIYALTATLFHALVLRPPTWSDDPERFWQMKRRGEVALPGPADALALPAALRAILERGLRAEPDERYQRMEDLVLDLQRFQAGQPVAAYPEPLWWHLLRWYRSHRQLTVALLLALPVILALIAALLIEQRKQLAAWQQVYAADFAHLDAAGLARDWQGEFLLDNEDLVQAATPERMASHWSLHDGALWATPYFDIEDLGYRHAVAGDLRVDWDATARKGNGNLNVVIGGLDRRTGITCHIGGYGDPASCRLTSGRDYRCLAEVQGCGPFTRDLTHQFSLLQEEGRITLLVDGRPVLVYQRPLDQIPLEQSFAFDSCYDCQWSVGGVRIYRRRPPEYMSPLALGDDAMRRHDFKAAQASYGALGEAFAGTELGVSAAFKSAIAAVYAGDTAAGRGALAELQREHPDNPLVARAQAARLKVARATGNRTEIDSLLAQLAATPGTTEYQSSLYDLISDADEQLKAAVVHRIGGPHSDPRIDTLARTLVPRVRQWAADLHRPECSDRFDSDLAQRLLGIGKGALVLELTHDPTTRRQALWEMGRFDELLSTPDLPVITRARILAYEARVDEALALAPDDIFCQRIRVAVTGKGLWPKDLPARFQDDLIQMRDRKDIATLLALYPNSWQCHDLLITLGRYDEELALAPTDFYRAYHILGDLAGSDPVRFQELLARVQLGDADALEDDAMVLHRMLPAIAAAWRGDDAAATAALERAAAPANRDVAFQQAWYYANRLLGRIDDHAFGEQPVRYNIAFKRALTTAWRAELDHQPVAALAAYREARRVGRGIDELTGTFIDKRSAAIARGLPAASQPVR